MASIISLIARDPASLNSDPPPARTPSEDRPTLLISWWCTGCALVLILLRLWGRYTRTEKLFMEDKIMALSIVPLLIRMALVDAVLIYGTNNTVTTNLGPLAIERRSVGSRLVLGSRIFYALFIWTAKWTVSEYLKRLTCSIWTRKYQIVLQCIRAFLVITFFAVVIATLAECQPFHHYWQVVPDPGPNCRAGYSQLLVMGSCDIITDLLIIAFPLPIIGRSAMPLHRKVPVIFLFSLSVILIVITSYRMAAIMHVSGQQQLRTIWASLEILAAAAVSNALILGSFLRDKGVKKKKFRGRIDICHNDSDSIDRGPHSAIVRTMTRRHWGADSDEDLFSTLRGRLESATDQGREFTPAGVAVHPDENPPMEPFTDQDTPDLEKAVLENKGRRLSQFNPSRRGSQAPPRKNSELMDVGGLLGVTLTEGGSEPSTADSTLPLTSRSKHDPVNNISSCDFADVGGLLSSSTGSSSVSNSATGRRLSQYSLGAAMGAKLQRYDTEGSNMSPKKAPSMAPSEPSISLSEPGTSTTQASKADKTKATSREGIEESIDRNIAMQLLAKIKEARTPPCGPSEGHSTPPSVDQGEQLDLSDVGGLLGSGGLRE